MKKICKVRFEDGHTEAISEETIALAKSLEALAGDPVWAPQIKVLATAVSFAAAAKAAGVKLP